MFLMGIACQANENNQGIDLPAVSDLKINSGESLNYFSVGFSHLSFSGTSSISANGIDFSFRRSISDSLPLSYALHASPFFNGNSLLTIEASAFVGLRVFGHPAYHYQVSDGVPLATQDISRSAIQIYIDLGVSVFPIFGESTTSTYSGLGAGISVYLNHWPVSMSLRCNSVSAVSRNATAFVFDVSYYWGER